MAKNKKNEGLRVDWTVQLDFEEDGSLKSVLTGVKPGEEESAGKILPELLQVAKIGAAQLKALPSNGVRLFEQIDLYLDEMSRSGQWGVHTAIDARRDFDQFKQILGDMPIAALGHDALNKLRDTLLPPQLSHGVVHVGSSIYWAPRRRPALRPRWEQAPLEQVESRTGGGDRLADYPAG